MSDIPTSNFSETAASNNAATPDGWPESQAPSTVNNCARELMGAIKREWNRNNPTVTSAGTNTVTLTYTTAPAAYVQGMRYSFIVGTTNTGATTLNVNALGAKAVQLAGAALTGGELVSGKVVEVVYDGTQFQILALPSKLRGGLIGIQYFTSAGTSTYTPTTGTNSVFVEVLGAGGGGGGCAATGAAQDAIGVGGGAGGYARKRITSAFSGVTVTVGASGTSSAGNNGTGGGTSSFGALISATGGSGGAAGGAASVGGVVAGGLGGSGSSGEVNFRGGQGGDAYYISTSGAIAPRGGASLFGDGGKSTATTSGIGGFDSAFQGGGGGGAANVASQVSALSGGNGGSGLVIVWEFA